LCQIDNIYSLLFQYFSPSCVALCNKLLYKEGCAYGLGLVSREVVVAHFRDQHDIIEHQCFTKALIVLTDFIQPFARNSQGQTLRQLNIIISPPPQDFIQDVPPVFLIHLEALGPKGLLVWTCLQIWGSERKYKVEFTLMREPKSSFIMNRGSNQDQNKIKATTIPKKDNNFRCNTFRWFIHLCINILYLFL